MELNIKNIKKSFSDVMVLKNVQLEVGHAEIHALLGENGAGKSTLMKILGGIYSKDEGEIYIDDVQIHINSIQDAEKHGITFIHQELSLLPEMSVLDNMFLGKMKRNKYGILDTKAMKEQAAKYLKLFNLDIDLNIAISNLSIGQRQLVELAKALMRESKLIIMDEPTAALTDTEVDALFKIIEDLKKHDVSVIYISHRLEEIFRITDKITVLRDGSYIGTKNTSDTNMDEVIKMMVGYELNERFPFESVSTGECVLSVQNLSKTKIFNDISFDVYAGEVLGFSGLIGSGRTEIMQTLFGYLNKDFGKTIFLGNDVNIKNPKVAKNFGIGFVTEDRKAQGLLLKESVCENTILTKLRHYSHHGFTNTSLIYNDTKVLKEKFNIHYSHPNIEVENLSGGNQQKIVLSKWVNIDPKLLILDEPTRGVDVGAKHEIYELINKLKQQGMAIIVVSSELPEVMGISDRIAVVHKQKIKAILERKDFEQEVIMQYATGMEKINNG